MLNALAKSNTGNGKGKAVEMFKRKQQMSPSEPQQQKPDVAQAPEQPDKPGSGPMPKKPKKAVSKVPAD